MKNVREMTQEEITAELRRITSRLEEMFDHVQVMGTWSTGKCTYHRFWGRGNWYARIGLAKFFLDEDIHKDLAFELAKNDDDEF